jgi:hypothetical protein
VPDDLTHQKCHPATGVCLTSNVTLDSSRMNATCVETDLTREGVVASEQM